MSAPTTLDPTQLAQAVAFALAEQLGSTDDRLGLALLLHDDRLLSVRQLAGLLGVSARTIDNMLERGDLPAPRMVGAHRRWRLADVRALIAVLPKAGGAA